MLTPHDLILVCVWPQVRDRELARLLGWYRIPFRKAPKIIAVDYLAFYQPAVFGAEGGQIQYAAAVLGHELVQRVALLRDEPEHPRAHEEYYKISIGPLERLKRPVRAEKWRRFAFFYTTGERLLRAETLRDLIIRDDERTLLWKALRERAAAQTEAAVPAPEADLPPDILAALLGLSLLDDFD